MKPQAALQFHQKNLPVIIMIPFKPKKSRGAAFHFFFEIDFLPDPPIVALSLSELARAFGCELR